MGSWSPLFVSTAFGASREDSCLGGAPLCGLLCSTLRRRGVFWGSGSSSAENQSPSWATSVNSGSPVLIIEKSCLCAGEVVDLAPIQRYPPESGETEARLGLRILQASKGLGVPRLNC